MASAAIYNSLMKSSLREAKDYIDHEQYRWALIRLNEALGYANQFDSGKAKSLIMRASNYCRILIKAYSTKK